MPALVAGAEGEADGDGGEDFLLKDDGNDVPLVTVDREVRLQFEGWPAIQFGSGWPNVALGTYGGRVAAVDATDNGKGKFRVLVRPELELEGVQSNRQGIGAVVTALVFHIKTFAPRPCGTPYGTPSSELCALFLSPAKTFA